MSGIRNNPCPVCGAQVDDPEGYCPNCGVLVAIRSDCKRIERKKLNHSVISDRIAELRHELDSNPENEFAHFGLGVAYFNLGLLETSFEEFSAVASIVPENPQIQALLGTVLIEMGRSTSASFSARAWVQAERALVMDAINGDALVLRQELIRQRLQAPECAPELRAASKCQLMETWKELARIDEDRVRPLVARFLSQQTDILQGTTGSPKNALLDEKWGFWRSLERAALWFVALFIAWIFFVVLSPEGDDGDIIIEGFIGTSLLVAFFSMFVIPVIVFMWGIWNRNKDLNDHTSVSASIPGNGKVLQGQKPPINVLLATAQSLLADDASGEAPLFATTPPQDNLRQRFYHFRHGR